MQRNTEIGLFAKPSRKKTFEKEQHFTCLKIGHFLKNPNCYEKECFEGLKRVMSNIRKKYLWVSLSPWAILASLAVLAPIAFFLAISTIKRDKENMTRLLIEKGAALTRSFEAGARTGMVGMGWGSAQIQRFLVETAQQPDILYLVVTDKEGVVVAHSDPSQIGQKHEIAAPMPSLDQPQKVRWHRVHTKHDRSVFEVYKRFTPLPRVFLRGGTRQHGMMMSQSWLFEKWDQSSPRGGRSSRWDWCRLYWTWPRPKGQPEPAHYIFAGLDMSALESAMVEAKRHILTMSAGALLIGFAGMVSLFLAQGYKLARRSLAKERAFSGQVVESLPMGLVATDEDGLVAAFNETAEEILGTASHKVLGTAAAQVVPSELWRLIDQLDKKGEIIEQDLECQTARSTVLPLRVSAAMLRGEEGSFLGYVFIFSDLTEVLRLRQEVERSRRQAALGDLAAGVAHEIRNPLSSIKGFATYFRERFKDYPKDRDTATTMIQEVERLDRVIGQLLEFARPSTLNIRPVRVADLIQHSIKLIEPDARAKEVKVRSEAPSDLVGVPMDPDRMNQVLLNLYLNSIQALDAGGTLEVKAFRDEKTKQTKIAVSDDGRGIDPADQERMFDPYFTTKSDGTGLGLAIVHKIMEAHGGDVDVKSAAGLGTTITLTLPDSEEVGKHGRG